MGLQLLPFSLSHKLFLEKLQSPFLSFDTKPSYPDLIRAVLVCTKNHAENLSTVDTWFYRLKLKLWLRREKRLDWDKEIVKLREHIALGSLCPRVKPEGGRAPGAPWVLRLYQFLTSVLKLSPGEAWDYRYGKAQFEWCSHWESEGSLKLWNSDDEQFEQWCKEQDKLEAAKQ